MPGTKILSAFLIMVPATILLTTEATLGEPAAEQCKASPGGAAPRGMHWYYRVNRATNKHCWYLGPGGAHVKSHTATAAVADPPGARKANPVDADNAAPMQAMPADGAEPAAPVQTAFAQAQTASAQTALRASSACRSSRNRQSSSRRTGLWRALAGGPSESGRSGAERAGASQRQLCRTARHGRDRANAVEMAWRESGPRGSIRSRRNRSALFLDLGDCCDPVALGRRLGGEICPRAASLQPAGAVADDGKQSASAPAERCVR